VSCFLESKLVPGRLRDILLLVTCQRPKQLYLARVLVRLITCKYLQGVNVLAVFGDAIYWFAHRTSAHCDSLVLFLEWNEPQKLSDATMLHE